MTTTRTAAAPRLAPALAVPQVPARRVWRGLAGMGLLAGLIQALAWWGPRHWAVPGLGQLASSVADLISAPHFAAAVLQTVESVVIAVAAGLVGAVVIGLTFGSSRVMYRAFGLPFEILRTLPSVAFIPLMILALGQGLSMEITVAAIGSWWPVLFNCIYGVSQVDTQARDAARVFGCGRLALAGRVVLPSTLPFVLAGLRTSAPIALIVVVATEYLAAGGRGLGGVLIYATSTGNLDVLWASAVVTGVLGILIGAAVALVCRVACPWSAARGTQ